MSRKTTEATLTFQIRWPSWEAFVLAGKNLGHPGGRVLVSVEPWVAVLHTGLF